VIDDVLATGGTLSAALQLIEKQGGIVERILLVNVIKCLNGISKLKIPQEKVFYIYEI
jgi:adenine phosphoribosyltransferase